MFIALSLFAQITSMPFFLPIEVQDIAYILTIPVNWFLWLCCAKITNVDNSDLATNLGHGSYNAQSRAITVPYDNNPLFHSMLCIESLNAPSGMLFPDLSKYTCYQAHWAFLGWSPQ